MVKQISAKFLFLIKLSQNDCGLRGFSLHKEEIDDWRTWAIKFSPLL